MVALDYGVLPIFARNARESTPVRRELGRCFGWHCLTAAEKSGIILSIVVVSGVLLLAYMYYLGRATISRRERTSVRLPGGRRVEHGRGQPSNTAIAPLPVVQQWPGYPAQVFYQPAVFSVDEAHRARAQPCVGRYHRHTPPAIMYPLPPIQHYATPTTQHTPKVPIQQQYGGHREASLPRIARSESNMQTSQAAPSSPPASGGRPRQPTLLQRLGRALRLPVGRASTIASTSVPGTPRRTVSRESANRRWTTRRDEEMAATTDGDADNGERGRQRQPPRGRRGSVAAEEDETRSLQTNVATVHSDDFRIVNPPSLLLQQLEADGDNDANMAELCASHWIPSESSVQMEERPPGRRRQTVHYVARPELRNQEESRPSREALRLGGLEGR
ncbi:hypothetical protein TOPH_00488 [Tolypocladium ophioglossoides CBS 100239]|uniref:Uncharacterized protein n=1 Tax=Tolypocladium ophioglossoides (strain CBS 100239) TaxID=1163406 RepID=A0A0L0NLT4_TOLOC|nr:hypothetical protein TOPH_00488 [Tolypocladium ophioglossoides CBS 100239]